MILKKIIILSTWILILLILASNIGLVKNIMAQEVSLGIYPPIMQIDSTPPAEPKGDIFLENNTDSSVDLNIVIKPFAPAQSKDGQLQIQDTFSAFPDPLFANRIKILDEGEAVKSITLAPKQGKKLQLVLQVPANEEKGDYYFSILFVSKNNNTNLANSSLATAAIAMNVLLTVGPKGATNGYIKEFETAFFKNSGPVPFTVNVVNKSDHFITPQGKIVIKNMFNQTIGRIDLLPVNILSNSERLIPDLKQQNPDSKEYAAANALLEEENIPVAIWPEKFLLGPYKATLTINLDDKSQTLSKTITFFAFPINYLIGIVLLIIILVFILLRVKKYTN